MRATGLDAVTQVPNIITARALGGKEAKGLAGRVALKALAKGATRAIPPEFAVHFGYAVASTLSQEIAYREARDKEIAGCFS